MSSKICVIGSSNIDQIAYTKNIPADGETLFGDSFQMGFGGKGANQAVMAGLLGACLLYTSPSPRDGLLSRMPSSA